MNGKTRSFYLSDVFTHVPFRLHLKARARLDPFFRFDFPVPVQIGA